MRYFENEQKRKIAQNVHKQVGWQIWSLSADAQQDKKLTITEAGSIAAAVLVAIAIPVFTSQLEKSRDATSVSNMRAGYAEIMTCVIAGTDGQSNVTGPAKGGDGTYTVKVQIKSQQDNDWSGVGDELPFDAPEDPGTAGEKTLSLTVADGAISTATLT